MQQQEVAEDAGGRSPCEEVLEMVQKNMMDFK